jgi:hypothetical protein
MLAHFTSFDRHSKFSMRTREFARLAGSKAVFEAEANDLM